jgi:hypothetical protein
MAAKSRFNIIADRRFICNLGQDRPAVEKDPVPNFFIECSGSKYMPQASDGNIPVNPMASDDKNPVRKKFASVLPYALFPNFLQFLELPIRSLFPGRTSCATY